MPRPPDHYTHGQYEPVAPNNPSNETVRCKHCKLWTGNVKVLNRKKEHLLKCPAYTAWRAAGNGQDVPPPNVYIRRESSPILPAPDDQFPPDPMQYSSPLHMESQMTDSMVIQKYREVSTAFEEYWNPGDQNSNRVRCKQCGFVCARDVVGQIDHLGRCRALQDSQLAAEVTAPTADRAYFASDVGVVNAQPSQMTSAGPSGGPEIWRGKAPNPNLSIHRQSPGRPRRTSGTPVTSTRPPFPPVRPKPQPSLVSHLLSRDPSAFSTATQQPFLSHAGCGTLSLKPLLHWIAQDSHMSRGFLSFIGALIGKIRLPETTNSHQNSAYRAVDLLISAATNMRREMNFFETLIQKYGLQPVSEEPKPATRSYLDLLAAASGSTASLLEGMVVLWATEHCYRSSWHYASTFTSSMTQPNYSVPSYLAGTPSAIDHSYDPTSTIHGVDNAHINALHEALIPNWTSPAFSKFVDTCRSIVDELANAQTTGSGVDEMKRCEANFRQVVWLWERIWPRVDVMGEDDGLTSGTSRQTDRAAADAALANRRQSTANVGGVNGAGTKDNNNSVVMADDNRSVSPEQDAAGDADSAYGVSGLEAVHAANATSR